MTGMHIGSERTKKYVWVEEATEARKNDKKNQRLQES